MLHIDRRLIKNFDWIIFSIAFVIVLIGILTIYSATRPIGEGEHPSFYIKQAIWLIVGIMALVVMVSFDYAWLGRFSLSLYLLSVLLLIMVLIFGKTAMGAQRWLSLGPISFQPSELFKIAYLIMLAHQLSVMQSPISIIALFRLFFLFVLLPFIIIIKQPDLGTSLIILSIFAFFVLMKGLHKKALILFIIIGLISLPFLGTIIWENLRDYQKSRLLVFLEPGVDPTGIGYHVGQSKIAVGSGKFFGKGYLNGTQGPLRFLPEKHTDFIFAVFAEEWGFFGSLLLLFLYMVFIMRGLDTARNARDDFGRLLALGITFTFLIYFISNVGMTLGLLPVVGISFPLMSYGGTALLSNFILIGILISVRIRRFHLA